MAEPEVDPSDYKVKGLRKALEDVDDPDELAYMLEWEELGDDRSTAKKAIRSRLHDVETGTNGSGHATGSIDLSGLTGGFSPVLIGVAGAALVAAIALLLGIVNGALEAGIVFVVLSLMVSFGLGGSGGETDIDADGLFGKPGEMVGWQGQSRERNDDTQLFANDVTFGWDS